VLLVTLVVVAGLVWKGSRNVVWPVADAPEAADVVTAVPYGASDRGPLVVYSPHPDDESIGMAYEIMRARADGREVYGVLLTDGEAAKAYARDYRLHPELWTDADGNGVPGERWDYGVIRREEYVRAMARLGVAADHLSFYGRSASRGATGLPDGDLSGEAVLPIVRRMAELHPGATHWTAAGGTAGSGEGPDAVNHRDHTAVAATLMDAWRTWGLPVAFFKVYVYTQPWADRVAPVVVFGPLLQAGKVAALSEYLPGPGRIGLGYESTKDFIAATILDTREFIVPPEDY
jgi:LmbE family N-acetylglucosaminyl deacetylase